MEFQTDQHHIYVLDDNGLPAAHIEFQETGNNTYDIQHTVVFPAYQGKLLASQLVERAIEEIHKRGAKVTASCSYAKKWMEKHEISE